MKGITGEDKEKSMLLKEDLENVSKALNAMKLGIDEKSDSFNFTEADAKE